MRVRKNRRKNSMHSLIKGILVLAVICAASFSLAFVWQNAQESGSAGGLAVDGPDLMKSEAEPVLQDLSGSGNQIPTDISFHQESGSSQEETEIPAETQAVVDGVVAESPRVDNSWFEDAIFFGDSLSTGIPLYQVGGSPDTVAYTGINTRNINTDEVIDTPDGRKTILEAAKQYGNKKKVYIMLGANGLGLDRDPFIEGYRTFLLSVREQYPNAVIYVQSMLPVTVNAHLEYPLVSNEIINEYNGYIKELAKSCGAYYLDVHSALCDENGVLPLEASPVDGMHLTPEYYNIWFDYLKTHTVVEGD